MEIKAMAAAQIERPTIWSNEIRLPYMPKPHCRAREKKPFFSGPESSIREIFLDRPPSENRG